MSLSILAKEFKRKSIAKIKRILYQTEKPIYNYYSTRFEKKALISYITAPLRLGVTYQHNNSQYVIEIAEILNSLGYQVDIVDFRDRKSPNDFTKYHLIVGFGDPFERSFSGATNAIRIFYGTIMSPIEYNQNTVKSLQRFYSHHGIWLPSSSRIISDAYPLQGHAIDAVIAYGNTYIHDTFKKYFSGDVYPLHNINFLFRDPEVITASHKDWQKVKKSFCAFPAAGMIHKGVDIMLDFFEKNPRYQFHLGAPITREPEFFKYYKKVLSLPNIHYHGFVDMKSQKYFDILDSCGFILSPSAGEGCPTSIINACTNSKIIPIASQESGLPEDPLITVTLTDISIAALSSAIELVQKHSSKALEKQALTVHKHFLTKHSKENFKKELKEAILAILSQS